MMAPVGERRLLLTSCRRRAPLRAIVKRIAGRIAQFLEIGLLGRRRLRTEQAADQAPNQPKRGADQRGDHSGEAELTGDGRIPEGYCGSHGGEAEAKGKHGAEPSAASPPDGEKQHRKENGRGRGKGHDGDLHHIDLGKGEEHAGGERRCGDRHPRHHQSREHLAARVDQPDDVVGETAGKGEEMGCGGGKRDGQTRHGREHGADDGNFAAMGSASTMPSRATKSSEASMAPSLLASLVKSSRYALKSLSQEGSAFAGAWAMSWNISSLTKAASAGALMANSATKNTPQATERR